MWDAAPTPKPSCWLQKRACSNAEDFTGAQPWSPAQDQPPPRSSPKAPFLALLISFSGAAASTYSARDSGPPPCRYPRSPELAPWTIFRPLKPRQISSSAAICNIGPCDSLSCSPIRIADLRHYGGPAFALCRVFSHSDLSLTI